MLPGIYDGSGKGGTAGTKVLKVYLDKRINKKKGWLPLLIHTSLNLL